MNVNKVLTKDYENDNAFSPHENKPNQTQSKPTKANFKTTQNPKKQQ